MEKSWQEFMKQFQPELLEVFRKEFLEGYFNLQRNPWRKSWSRKAFLKKCPRKIFKKKSSISLEIPLGMPAGVLPKARLRISPGFPPEIPAPVGVLSGFPAIISPEILSQIFTVSTSLF